MLTNNANLQILAESLSKLFSPQVEIVFYGENLGPKLSSFAVSEDPLPLPEEPVISTENLRDGRKVRQLLFPIKNQRGKSTGVMRVRYDLTPFTNLHEQLEILLSPSGRVDENANNNETWQKALKDQVHHFFSERNMTLQSASRSDKRTLILELYRKGTFDYKEASKFLAALLKLSRASVYNYLNWAVSISKIKVHRVDAFTKKRKGGNPAGVVLDANNFTPSGHEIKFCGHSTVGALFMLALEKRFGMQKPGSYVFQVETAAGILAMEIHKSSDSDIRLTLAVPKITFAASSITHKEIAETLGLSANQVNVSLPILFEKTNQDLFVTVHALADLEAIRCDVHKLRALSAREGIVAFCVLTPHAFAQGYDAHIRVFAPAVGVTEDAFTGSVQGALAAYMHRYGLVKSTQLSFHVEQGHFMKRPGTVRIELQHTDGEYTAKLIAEAVHFFSADVQLV